MVDSIKPTSASGVQSAGTTGLSEEEKQKKTQEEGELFEFNANETVTSGAQLDEDTARTTVQSYISSLKAQYPKLAAKLDSYYSHLDFEALLADAASTSDVKAYIYNETQSLLE